MRWYTPSAADLLFNTEMRFFFASIDFFFLCIFNKMPDIFLYKKKINNRYNDNNI